MYLNTFLVISPSHVILVVVALLLLFGGKKIPELMKGFGEGMREFKKATQDDSRDNINPQKELNSKSE